MIIDIHTHVFPDAMADKTIDALAKRAGTQPFSDGKLSGLLTSMEKAGVDISVIAPVVTAPRQFDSINRFAREINETYGDANILGMPKLISLGGIHPDTEDYKDKLKELKNMGFKGIKLHPDYQGVMFNDIRYKRVVSYATELDMFMLVHAGVDVGLPDPVHCTPAMSREVLDETQSDKVILAHLGGFDLWDDVERFLVGQNVYLDTAFINGYISSEQFERIVKNHGSHKILFGSDSPWGGQKEAAEWLNGMRINDEEKQDILSGNAVSLLKS